MGFETAPSTLLKLTADYCVNNLSAISCNGKLKNGIKLPAEVSQTLFEATDKEDEEFEAKFIPLFQDPISTPLHEINVRNSKITSEGLSKLLAHKPQGLNINNCPRLSPLSLSLINEHSSNLTSLIVGTTTQILPEGSEEGEALTNPIISGGGIFQVPNLERLSVHLYSVEIWVWEHLVVDWSKLTHLDLTGCDGLGDLNCLKKATNLTWLCLFNVLLTEGAWENICTFNKLRHLDVSRSSELSSIYTNTQKILTALSTSLPFLTSLDISGTNLAGRGIGASAGCDIPGLESRICRPFEFLGLYGAHHDASHRHSIPAKRIAGDKDESQVLVACRAYIDRSELLEKILNDLFHLHRAESGMESEVSLGLILEAMRRHIPQKHVQISGSASLFYIIRHGDNRTKLDFRMRRQILETLIKAMRIHFEDTTMIRNGCLIICMFQIPQDLLFRYRELVEVILNTLKSHPHTRDDFVERIATYLLNALACQVESKLKILVGELGAIEIMLNLISKRLEEHQCDEVMEVAWSTMWNVTDETPDNCSRFLEGRGMTLFIDCLRLFPDQADLLRNMMGLLGNVAECAHLRPQLMNEDFIIVFFDLLDSTQDQIEVSYNAAGVLAHILSDGQRAWSVAIERKIVIDKLKSSILRWDIGSKRNINYRSFHPILRLLSCDTDVCQLWAVWALANLTKVYPSKYCEILLEEGGMDLLEPLTGSESQEVAAHAQLTLDNLLKYNQKYKKLSLPPPGTSSSSSSPISFSLI